MIQFLSLMTGNPVGTLSHGRHGCLTDVKLPDPWQSGRRQQVRHRAEPEKETTSS